MTKKLTNIKRKDRSGGVYMTYPIVEAKRQSNTNTFQDPDKNVVILTDSLVKKSLHKLLTRKKDHFYFANYDSVDKEKMKSVLDSIMAQFKATKYKQFKITQDLKISTDRKFILIPFYTWTRSTEDYDYGNCRIGGHSPYAFNWYCTWTGSNGGLIMINKENRKVSYFHRYGWRMATIFNPDQARVTRQLRRVTKPLVRKLKRFK